MPFFLEYSSEETAGRVRLEAVTAEQAEARAQTTVIELQCTSAVVRYSEGTTPAFGAGAVIAVYSRGAGWRGQPEGWTGH